MADDKKKNQNEEEKQQNQEQEDQRSAEDIAGGVGDGVSYDDLDGDLKPHQGDK